MLEWHETAGGVTPEPEAKGTAEPQRRRVLGSGGDEAPAAKVHETARARRSGGGRCKQRWPRRRGRCGGHARYGHARCCFVGGARCAATTDERGVGSYPPTPRVSESPPSTTRLGGGWVDPRPAVGGCRPWCRPRSERAGPSPRPISEAGRRPEHGAKAVAPTGALACVRNWAAACSANAQHGPSQCLGPAAKCYRPVRLLLWLLDRVVHTRCV